MICQTTRLACSWSRLPFLPPCRVSTTVSHLSELSYLESKLAEKSQHSMEAFSLTRSSEVQRPCRTTFLRRLRPLVRIPFPSCRSPTATVWLHALWISLDPWPSFLLTLLALTILQALTAVLFRRLPVLGPGQSNERTRATTYFTCLSSEPCPLSRT